MLHVNENYLKLPGNYLFSDIASKVKKYQEAHPDANIIRLASVTSRSHWFPPLSKPCIPPLMKWQISTVFTDILLILATNF